MKPRDEVSQVREASGDDEIVLTDVPPMPGSEYEPRGPQPPFPVARRQALECDLVPRVARKSVRDGGMRSTMVRLEKEDR